MHQRYLVTIAPVGRPLPPPLADRPHHRAVYEIAGRQVIVDTADTPIGCGLSIEAGQLPRTLTLTEGHIVAADTPAWPQSGVYNQIVIDADGLARIHNDTFGLLACFYHQAGDLLHISNSLRLLRHGAELAWDDLGIAAMYLFGGWTPTERTILRDGRRLAAGTEVRFRLDGSAPPTTRRLTAAWSTVIDQPLGEVVEHTCEIWERAVERHIDPINTPIGLMLSGGLDSRLVAGAIASRGKQIIGLTFGDLNSDEVRIAGEVAAAVGGKWLPRGMDESFAFERLAFDRINYLNETMYNLMWDANLPELVAEGATHFSSGATFETTFGGQRDLDARRRLLKNLRQSLLGPWPTGPATPAEIDALTEMFYGQARKRARNYSRLLAEPYRSLMTDSLPAIRQELAGRLAEMAAIGPVSIGQVRERFESEHYQTQHSRDQERQLQDYGTPALPTCDRDVANYLTNLPVGMKYDHALYYRVFRRLYPQLAAIQVPNLSTNINKSQLRIELTRAWHIQRRTRLSPWVNFSQWMTLGDNLAKYERLFLEQSHFFDPDAIRAYFGEVRAGQQSLYDGSETAGFLNLAYLLDERRAAVRREEFAPAASRRSRRLDSWATHGALSNEAPQAAHQAELVPGVG